MEKIRLGRTGMMVSRSGFGAIPIQRLDKRDADRLLRKAYDSGINFFDTSRSYTDSEEKIGLALSGVRGEILLATKNKGTDRQKVLEMLDTPALLKTMLADYEAFLEKLPQG